MKRRNFLYGTAGALAALTGGAIVLRDRPGGIAMAETFEITKSEEESNKVEYKVQCSCVKCEEESNKEDYKVHCKG